MRKTILTTAPLAALLLLSCAQKPSTQKPDITYMPQPPFNPPTYVCYKAPAPIKIDGKLSPGEWDAIPWTSDFVDIEGDKRPAPHFQTRAKMTYDDVLRRPYGGAARMGDHHGTRRRDLP